MVLDIRTQTFQDTFNQVNELYGREDIQSLDVETQQNVRDDFLRQKNIDPDDYQKALTDYINFLDDPENKGLTGEQLDDALSPGEGVIGSLGRVSGIALGGAAEAGEWLYDNTLGWLIPDEVIEAGDKFINEEVLGEEGQKDMQALFDPYTPSGAEQISGEILSYVLPVGALAKAGAMTRSASNIARIPGVNAKTASKLNRALSTKPSKILGYGVAGGLTDVAINDPTYRVVQEILEDEDANSLMERLARNPEDAQAEAALEDFLVTLQFEGGIAGGLIGLIPIWKKLSKSRALKKLTTPLSKYLTSRGGTDDTFLAKVLRNKAGARAAFEEAEGLAMDLERAVKKDPTYKKLDKEGKKAYVKNMDDVLKNKASPDQMSEEVVTILGKMRGNVDTLSESLVDDVFTGKLKATVDENLKTYLNRSYQFFLDPKFQKKISKQVQQYIDNPTDPKVNSLVKDAANFLIKEGGFEANSNALRNKLSELFQTRESFDAFESYAKLAPTLRKRKDIPKEFRALWGEVENPYQNYVNTFTNLSRMRSQADFSRDVLDDLIGRGVASVKPGKPQRGEGDLGEVMKNLNAKVFGTSKEAVGQLNKHIADTIKKNGGEGDNVIFVDKAYTDFINDNLNPKDINKFLKYWGATKGLTQAMKTIYNPTTHGRNTMGNVAILAANGIVPLGSAFDAARTVGKSLLGLSDEALGKKLAEYQRLNIIGSRVDLGLIRDNMRAIANEGDKKFASTFEKRNKLRRLNNKVVDLYQAEDDIFKIMHFEDTKKMMAKAFPNSSADEIAEMAAQRTRDMMPNYALVPKLFKSFRYSPVGDFLAFPAEMTRISKNLVKYTIDDFFSDNPVLRRAAARRLAGMTAVGAVPEYMQSFTAAQHDISPEQESALENVLPSWYQDVGRIYLGGIKKNPETGTQTVDMLNLGPLDPFEYIKTAARGLHRAYLSGEALPGEENTIALRVLQKQIDPFVGPSMLTETILDFYNVATGKKDSLRPYPKGSIGEALQRNLGGIFGDLSALAVQPFKPGFLDYLERRVAQQESIAAERGMEVPLASYFEGIDPTGMVEGLEPTGREFRDTGSLADPESMNIADFLGLKSTQVDLTRGMDIGLRRAIRESNDATSEFNQYLNQQNLGPQYTEGIYDAYAEANEQAYDGQLRLKNLLDEYATLGMDFTTDLEPLRLALTKYGQRGTPIDQATFNKILQAVYGNFTPIDIPEMEKLFRTRAYQQGGLSGEVISDLLQLNNSFKAIRLKNEE